MVTPRIKKETSRFFASATDTTSPAPRRITRSSLAKFAFDSAPSPQDGCKIEDLVLGADIEDAVTRSPRKRKRSLPTRNADATIKLEATTSSTTLTGPKIKDENKNTTPKPRRARKPARKTLDPQTGESHVEPPSDWLEIYNTVLAMRQPGGVASNAAVDTMGCERLADREASPRDQRFHTLVALMLSSQTKDTVNAVVMAKLKTELPAWKEGEPLGLNLENMLAVDPDVLNQFIWAVGFHNNKTKYLKQTAVILRDKWNSDIPDTITGLTSLPGVGPKMAHLCLSSAWGRTEGIGVDVHVHRLTNLWGWHKTNNPEATRLALESWLPRDKWREINWLLVGFGQTVCLPVGRRCGDCELGLRGLCGAADRGKVLVGRRAREMLGADDTKLENVGVEAKIKVDEGDGEEGNAEGFTVKVEGDGAAGPVVKAEAADEDVSEALARLQDSKTAPAPGEEFLTPTPRIPGKRRTRR